MKDKKIVVQTGYFASLLKQALALQTEAKDDPRHYLKECFVYSRKNGGFTLQATDSYRAISLDMPQLNKPIDFDFEFSIPYLDTKYLVKYLSLRDANFRPAEFDFSNKEITTLRWRYGTQENAGRFLLEIKNNSLSNYPSISKMLERRKDSKEIVVNFFEFKRAIEMFVDFKHKDFTGDGRGLNLSSSKKKALLEISASCCKGGGLVPKMDMAKGKVDFEVNVKYHYLFDMVSAFDKIWPHAHSSNYLTIRYDDNVKNPIVYFNLGEKGLDNCYFIAALRI